MVAVTVVVVSGGGGCSAVIVPAQLIPFKHSQPFVDLAEISIDEKIKPDIDVVFGFDLAVLCSGYPKSLHFTHHLGNQCIFSFLRSAVDLIFSQKMVIGCPVLFPTLPFHTHGWGGGGAGGLHDPLFNARLRSISLLIHLLSMESCHAT